MRSMLQSKGRSLVVCRRPGPLMNRSMQIGTAVAQHSAPSGWITFDGAAPLNWLGSSSEQSICKVHSRSRAHEFGGYSEWSLSQPSRLRYSVLLHTQCEAQY